MTPFEITQIVTLLANAIDKSLTDDDLAILAAVFTQLGDTLATILVAKDIGK